MAQPLPSCSCQPGHLAHDCPRHGLKDASATRKKKVASRGRINPVSVKQADKKARWALIKESMIQAQIRTQGFTSCMVCGAKDPKRLDLDHIVPAGKGGEWEPRNAQLVCGGQGSCHSEKHGEPQWTKNR